MLSFLMFMQTAGYTDKLIDALISMGPGGVLAALVFHFYRQDRQSSTERFKLVQDQFVAYAQDFKSIVQDNTKVIQSNTDCIKEALGRINK